MTGGLVVRNVSYQSRKFLTRFGSGLRFRVSGDSVFGTFTTEPITAMAALTIRADLSSEELRRLTRGESDGRVCRRLLAIAMALDGISREEAARQAGMDRQTLRDHRLKSAYLFGAVCPARDTGAAIVMTRANAEAMTLMLEEISRAVAPGPHAAAVIDGAGWRTSSDLLVPSNLTLVPLPPYSPELNAIESEPHRDCWRPLFVSHAAMDMVSLSA